MDRERLDDAILAHLYTIARAKQALLEVARSIRDEHPTEANLLLRTIRELTVSADKLLGDTAVTGPGG